MEERGRGGEKRRAEGKGKGILGYGRRCKLVSGYWLLRDVRSPPVNVVRASK